MRGPGRRRGAGGAARFGTLCVASLLAVAAACHSEPSPTVATPPNPTSAPSSVLPACTVPAVATAPAPSDPGDYTIVQPGLLTVGSVTDDPPFESIANQVATGFDISLIGEVGRRLGLRTEVVGESLGSLLPDVAGGKTDVAISALSVTPAAAASVDFTGPYFTDDLALTVGVDQARNFPGFSALAGKTVGVAAGSYGESCAKLVSAEPGEGFDVKLYTDISQAFTDLSVGRIQGVLTDLPTSDRLVEAIVGLQMVEIYRTGDAYAIAVAKSNPNLRADIDRILADMRADGTYKLIYEQWFQVPPPSG